MQILCPHCGKDVTIRLMVESRPAEPEITDTRVEDLALDFSVRVLNCLHRADVQTIGQLIQHSEASLLRMKNLGKRSVREIKYVLQTMNLSLSPWSTL